MLPTTVVPPTPPRGQIFDPDASFQQQQQPQQPSLVNKNSSQVPPALVDSETQVEFGGSGDKNSTTTENEAQRPPVPTPHSSSSRSMSRSLSGEVIVVANPAASKGPALSKTTSTATLGSLTAPPLSAGAPTATLRPWVPPEEPHRAVHRIRLTALEHNYHQVEAAASRQKCDVITVVKADGYGHGAIATALHLADACGASAFAVATLEEGIALRKALAANPPGQWTKQLAALFHTQHHYQAENTLVAASGDGGTTTTTTAPPSYLTVGPPTTTVVPPPPTSNGATGSTQPTHTTRRPSQIRILVLGPPVGFPRCFDDYYHHNIEVMVSGPEVAASLVHWVADEAQRKRTAVERAANEAKYAALYHPQQHFPNPSPWAPPTAAAVIPKDTATTSTEASVSTAESTTTGSSWNTATNSHGNGDSSHPETAETTAATAMPAKKSLPHPSSTLGNVQGADLAREVRSLLLHQQEQQIKARLQQQQMQMQVQPQHSNLGSASGDCQSADESFSGVANASKEGNEALPSQRPPFATAVNGHRNQPNAAIPPAPTSGGSLFGGIEAAARSSRQHEAATAWARAIVQEDEEDDGDADVEHDASGATSTKSQSSQAPKQGRQSPPPPPPLRKRLRWHALVDSGMGRLGFKTDIVSAHDKTGRRDTVAILREMVDLELQGNAPIEFFGMCTHMADARDLSDYTQSQIGKFSALLKRVRAAGILVPTVSTDNSAALLTTSLTHFDPVQMLSQPGADTRGYVRTGGAIFGQRPVFPQLKAVSTLLASVRHVAILNQGDTVGYDRAYVAPHAVRIATLTIGFADGYPRELGNGVGKVQIRGAVFPVAGNVCMDMIMIDLGPASDKTGPGASVMVGDTAVLWGPLDEDVENGGDNQGMVRLQDIAATLKTTQSALTCGLDKMRVRRQFV